MANGRPGKSYKNAVISLVPDRKVDLLVSHKYLHLHLYINFDYTPLGVAVVWDFFAPHLIPFILLFKKSMSLYLAAVRVVHAKFTLVSTKNNFRKYFVINRLIERHVYVPLAEDSNSFQIQFICLCMSVESRLKKWVW